MADKLFIIMVNTDPANPAEASAPFFQATVAAAMEYEVEILLSGRSADLARRGVAERIAMQTATGRTLYDFIRDAHEAGVVIKLCTPSLDTVGEDLIPEIGETVGGAYVISEAMNDDTVTLTY